MRQLLFLISSCCFFACTNDEQDMKYGEEQVLTDTEWTSISEYYSSDKSLSPVGYPKNQTISFSGDNFTITTQTTVYDKDLQTTKDSIILTNGKYLYKHPSLYLNTDDVSVEAWISPLNHICFYDNDIFREFEKNK